MNIGWVIFDYFEHGGVQRDLAAMAQACKDLAQAQGLPWRSTLICMRNRSGRIPVWCDEVIEISPPGYLFSNHARAAYFARRVAAMKPRFNKLAGFNRMAGLDLYFAGDDCLKEKYAKRNFFIRHSCRAKVFQRMEAEVFAPVSAGGAQCIFTITAAQQASFLRNYPECEASRMCLMPPQLAEEYFAPPVSENEKLACRKELDIAPETLMIIQVAAAFRTKGVDRSCRILGEAKRQGILPPFCFVVAGGDEKQIRQIRAEAAQAGLTETEFRTIGVRMDIRRLLSSADLMLHPARAESAGNVLLEALACSLPVMSSGVCGYNDYLTHSGGGMAMAAEYDEAAFVAALQKVLADDGKHLARLREAAETYRQNSISPENFRRAEKEAALLLKLCRS